MRIQQVKSLFFLIVLVMQFAAGNSPAQSAATNLTIDGAVIYQTMDGIGSNVGAWAWKNGELSPALDKLIDTLGHNIFRVVYDPMDWAGNTSTRPAALLLNLRDREPAALMSVYETPNMQSLWGTIGYLNSRGIRGDRIILNFMGWTAPWMGGSGSAGTLSLITDTPTINQDMATMIASLVYYGHHRRDVSGANQNLSFGYLAPFNETDLNGLEGPWVEAAQLNVLYENILNTLEAMGDTTTKLVGPDTAFDPTSFIQAYSQDVLERMDHFTWHSYAYNGMSPIITRNGISDDWMSERSVWCDTCNNNLPLDKTEWLYGAQIGGVFLDDIANGFSAVITWEGFDTIYYHDNMYMGWGHLSCTQNGGGCTTSDAYPRVYSIRGRAWAMATIAKAIRPGMVRREVTTSVPDLKALAFYNPATCHFSLVGYNSGASAITIEGELENFPAIDTLFLHLTNATNNRQRMNDVPVSGGQFTAAIPADSFFSLTSMCHSTFIPNIRN